MAPVSTCAPWLLRDALGVEQFVNADVLAEGLSAYGRATVDFHAGRLMAQRLRELAARRNSFGFETTLATRSYVAWLRELRWTGYGVRVLYVWIASPDLAVERVKQRAARGGHDVPESVVRRRYLRSARNFFSLYRPIADSWAVWENAANGPPRRIAFGSDGADDIVLHSEPWLLLSKLGQ
jgi:predicted ABC-type ATPase